MAGVCSRGVEVNFQAEFDRITSELQPDLEQLQGEWPARRIARLRGVGSGMLDGPLANSMMPVTPCPPNRPQIGLAINYLRGSSCHTHTKEGIGERAQYYLEALGLSANTFMVAGVNDGVTNGYPEMSASLRSRDIVASEVQNTSEGAGVHGVVGIPACDKGFPGMMMAAVLLDRPFVIVPGGSAPTGRDPETGRKLGILDVFHAEALEAQGQITNERRQQICSAAINPGNCNGVFTADTMASLNEVLGLGVVGSGNNIANTVETDRVMIESIEALMYAMENQFLPRAMVTKESLDNAVTLLSTIGGSTNAVLHLLALAKVAEVPYGYADMQKVFDRTPFRLKMQPNAPDGFWEEYVEAGGIKGTIRQLLDEDRLNPDAFTMNHGGMTLGEAYQDVEPIPPYDPNGVNSFFMSQKAPILRRAHLTIPYGNLAEKGCVMKVNDPEKLQFDGQAIVFESEQDALAALAKPNAFDTFNGKVVVVRNLGPKAAGMPELLKVDKALQNLQKGGEKASTLLVSDARQSGGAGHPNVTHVSPEAYVGGTIAIVRDGDRIVVDANKRRIELMISDEEIAARLNVWKKPPPPARVGIAAVWAAHARGAEEGATVLVPAGSF